MVIYRAINASWTRRIQFAAFAGLASVSILAAGPEGLRAEWFAFKKIPVPVESLEPQPNDGFDKAIRNLLKEAKRHEKKGELDQAIILAERAAKISEESSSLVKVAPDISSSAISDYAKELRSRKQQIAQSQKRAKTQTSNSTAIASSRSAKESLPAKDKSTPPSRSKSRVAAESVASQVRSKENPEKDLESTIDSQPSQARPKSQRNDTRTVAVNTATQNVPESEPVDIPSPSERVVERVKVTKKPEVVTKIVASTEEPPFEPFIEEEPRQTIVQQDIRSFPKSTAVASREVIHTENVDETPDQVKSTLISSSPRDSEQPTIPSDAPQTVKLRLRYQDAEPRATASIKSASGLRTRKTEAKVTTASIETSENSDESNHQSFADPQENEYPVIQVRDLRQAIGDSSDLDPGKPMPTSTISKEESPEVDEEQQPVPVKSLSPFRIRRSLKLRNNYSVLPLLTPIVARSTREPVVGRTSIIHWRPAKQTSSVVTDDPIPESEMKTNVSAVEIRRMQSDTDKSILDHSSTGIRHGSARDSKIQAEIEAESSMASPSGRTDENSSSARREFRGSLWDHAAAPAFEGTWKPANPHSDKQRSAPLPPKANRIEQTAFIQPQHTIKKDLRSEMNHDSIGVSEQAPDSTLESSSEIASFAETSDAEQSADSPSWMDDAEPAESIATHDSIQQSVGETGLSESTVSTMLGAFGVGLLIAGIWVFRATAGIKHA